MKFEAAEPSDSKAIAGLHKNGIPTGFLSSLEIGLLEALYSHMIKKEIVIVARDSDKVTAYVSATLNLKRLYLRFILGNIFVIARRMLSLTLTANFFRKVIETLTIPFRKQSGNVKMEDLPELLSIVIDENSRGKGIGGELIKHLETRLKAVNCQRYRVVVGDQLDAAKKFYSSLGFKEHETDELHKGELSHILIKDISL
jgi:ribosomal protein S18 acetylase RimI-like enzyme